MSIVSYTKGKRKIKKKKKLRHYIWMAAGVVFLLNLLNSAVTNLYAIKQAKSELAEIEQQIRVQEIIQEELEQESKDPTITLERKAREMGYGSLNDQVYMLVE